MLENPRDEGPPTGQGGGGPGDGRPPQAMAAPRAWMGLRDPGRIVRVSRSLGGKDRHSKVNTIRGLRDRRVRLSVPTALQLYDLQDKLGLSQPSKAVDWLLNAAQHEIDKLPPLQFTPGSFIQFPPAIAAPHGTDTHDHPTSGPAMDEGMELMRENGSGSLTLLPSRDHMGVQTAGVHKPTKYWTSELIPPRARWKENTRAAMDEKDGLIRRLVEQDRHHGEEVHSTIAPVHPSLTSMASNNNAYTSYYYNLEGPNICVAHVGGYVIPQGEETHGYRPQQLLLCPSGMPSPMFSPQMATPPADYYAKHANSFHMGSSTNS